MVISLQEGNSSHPESDTRGLSKARLAENSWIFCWRNRKNIHILSGSGIHRVIFGLYLLLSWDYGLSLNSHLLTQRNISQMPYSLYKICIQCDVTDFENNLLHEWHFHLLLYGAVSGCSPVIDYKHVIEGDLFQLAAGS